MARSNMETCKVESIEISALCANTLKLGKFNYSQASHLTNKLNAPDDRIRVYIRARVHHRNFMKDNAATKHMTVK